MPDARASTVAVLLLALPLAQAAGQERRGPIEVREHWLLLQPRLTLPAVSTDVLPAGRTLFGMQLDWGNDLGWQQDIAGENPRRRSFLVDGEHRTLALEWRRGLRPGLEVGLRTTLEWRGGGALDGVIDWFHGFTRKLGLPDNGRRQFRRGELRVLGRDSALQPLAWSGEAGTALGDLELQGRWAVRPRSRAGWPVTLLGRVQLPTASGALESGGLALGAQLASSHRLSSAWDLYLGAGFTAHEKRRLEGLRYRPLRPAAFAALEWRPARRLSLLLQLDGAGRALEDVDAYPSLQSYLRLGTRYGLARRWQLEAGFAENIKHQQATTDFAVFLGLTRGF